MKLHHLDPFVARVREHLRATPDPGIEALPPAKQIAAVRELLTRGVAQVFELDCQLGVAENAMRMLQAKSLRGGSGSGDALLDRARNVAVDLAEEPAEGTDFVIGRTFRFVAYGTARPQGSKVAFVGADGGAVMKEDAPDLMHWRRAVGWSAVQQIPGRLRQVLIEGPCRMDLTIYRQRPASAKSGVRFPWTRPDTSKLLRAVEDALTGVLYRDDSRIVDHTLRKRFGSPARIEVVITELLEVPPQRRARTKA